MKSFEPVVSVTMPYYSGEKYLREAIASVANQTYTDLELVVVDDGSPGVPVSESLRDLDYPWLKVVRHDENRGLAAARNTGFLHAKGMFIVPLDHDDLIKPAFVERCVSVLADEDIGGVFSQVEIFGEHEEIWSPNCDLIEIMAGNAVPSTIMYRRVLFESVNGYRNEIASVDTDFWIRALDKGWRVTRIDEPLFRYRKQDVSRSRTGQLTEVSDLAAMNIELYRKHLLEVLKGFEQRYNKKSNEYNELEKGFKNLHDQYEGLTGAYEKLLAKVRKRSLKRSIRKVLGLADKG